MALALNLEPCFTPVESPESNGMAEAFVRTFKRDYVHVNPIPDAATALAVVAGWMEDYNTSPSPQPARKCRSTTRVHQSHVAASRLSGVTGSTP